MAVSASDLRKIQAETLRRFGKDPIVMAEVDAIMTHMVSEIKKHPTFTSFNIARKGTIIDPLFDEFKALGFVTTRTYAPCNCNQYRAQDGVCSCGNAGQEGIPCVEVCTIWHKATPHTDDCTAHTCTGIHITW